MTQKRKLDCYEQYFAQINMYVTKRLKFTDRGCYDEAKKFLLKNISAFYYDINLDEQTVEYHADCRPVENPLVPGSWGGDLYEFSRQMSELGRDPARPAYLRAGGL